MEVPIVLTPGIWDSLYQIHVNKYGIGGQPDTFLARPYKKLIDSEKFYRQLGICDWIIVLAWRLGI